MRVNFGRISPFAPVLKEISVDAALAVAARPKGDVDALVHLAKDDMAEVDSLIDQHSEPYRRRSSIVLPAPEVPAH